MVLEALGIPSIGRPSNAGGVEFLLEILAPLPADRPIIVVAENDQKANGSWPGRDGTVGTATRLVQGLGRPVSYAFPPARRTSAHWFLAQDLGDPGGADWAATRERLRDGLLEALLASARLEAGWEAGWEEPLPFHEVALPAFPVEALAPWQRDFVEAEATATQTPPDLPAMLALSVTSVACAGSSSSRSRMVTSSRSTSTPRPACRRPAASRPFFATSRTPSSPTSAN